jgi:uncharacterized protein (DUF1778 family)
MPRRRQHPLPNLSISLESLPPPDNVRRDKQFMLRFTKAELTMIERAAEARGEQASVLIRTIILTAFQSSALRALGERRDLLEMPPAEQQKALLEAFSFEEKPSPGKHQGNLPPKHPPKNAYRDQTVMTRLTQAEFAMIERAAGARGEQPAVLMRAIVLTAFENSALRAAGEKRDVHQMSLIEQQKALLEAFSFEE